MSKITISCMNVKCNKGYGASITIEKEDPMYFKDGSYVCPHCGQVIEVDEKPSRAMDPMMRKRILVGLAALIVIAGIICGIIFGVKSIRNKAEQRRIAAIEQARLDSIAKAEVAVRLAEEQAAEAARMAAEQQAAELAAAEAARLEAEAAAAAEAARLAEEEAAKAKKASATPSRAESGRLSYGKWSGSWKSGKPNGTGTMRYTEEHLIDTRDPQKRVAKAGDYIIGEFANGRLVQGVWYDSANNVKGSIIIGM